MQVPVQSGVKLQDGGFAVSYPVNLEHRIIDSGLSQGQLVSVRGVETLATGPGLCRGAIYWDGLEYRVMGARLVSVSGSAVTDIGDVGGSSPVRMAYGNERLAVVSEGRLFYWDKTTLVEVTDPDLGRVEDVSWLDGYFLLTDGEFSIATSLTDPTDINPLRYGSAERDPDPVTGNEVFNEELYLIGRHTIQVQQNVGSINYPFANVRGATVPYGCVSAHAKCQIAGTLAFVGGGREEPLGVFILTGGSARRISTREIETLFDNCHDCLIEMEAIFFGEDDFIVVHTPNGSAMLKVRTALGNNPPLWTLLHSGLLDPYRVRHVVWDGERHTAADLSSNALGVLSEATTDHFGQKATWRFDVGLLYNEGTGLILEEIELAGQFPVSEPSSIFVSVTRDGELWSNEAPRRMTGIRGERCLWRPQVRMPAASGARFRGDKRVAIARCDISGEVLAA